MSKTTDFVIDQLNAQREIGNPECPIYRFYRDNGILDEPCKKPGFFLRVYQLIYDFLEFKNVRF
jgi:hypothetical protein